MGLGQIIIVILSLIGMMSALIGVYIKMVTDAAIANQKHIYLERQVVKLETRVNEIEDNAVIKIDKIQESLQKMEINISMLLNK
jgi:hypothetical protein